MSQTRQRNISHKFYVSTNMTLDWDMHERNFSLVNWHSGYCQGSPPRVLKYERVIVLTLTIRYPLAINVNTFMRLIL